MTRYRRCSQRCVLIPALLLGACSGVAPRESGPPEQARATLAILESTDIHSNIRSFDYYKLAEDPSLGFERLATLVKEARAEYPNTLLFDAGDTIQGTALADYQALVDPVGCEGKLAMYRAMDALGYDGGTLGNHEFNYGLPFLAQVTGQTTDAQGASRSRCQGPNFPLVLANVFRTADDQPLYAPTGWIDRQIRYVGPDGKEGLAGIRIGMIGFTPPPITLWDKHNLQGSVYTKGMVEAAREFLPGLRAQDVDLVVAISHGGLNVAPYGDRMENANWHLAREPGIDALLLGHSHAAFPDPDNPKSRFAGMPGVDNQRGFVHGKPAVMGGYWGKSLGVIELGLVRRDGRWQIDPAATHSEVRSIRRVDGSFVEADAQIASLVEDAHRATMAYVSTPIGDSDFAMTTYFAMVGDVSALQPVNMAQRDYVQRYVAANLPALRNIPVLSAAAPFKAGFGGNTDFTDVAAGPTAIRNAADLYLYPNTLSVVRIDGADLKGWLERSAGFFNQIDPGNPAPQELVNRKTPSYNFDVIHGGIRYLIDISKPVGNRIVDLRYEGKPVAADQAFLLATNNYRASGGGDFPGTGESRVLFHAPDMNRSILIDWIRQRKHLSFADNGSDQVWRFAPLRTAGPIVFRSAAGKLDLARHSGLRGVSLMADDGSGMALYAIELSPAQP